MTTEHGVPATTSNSTDTPYVSRTLFEEAVEGALLSASIFAFADLRSVARKQLVSEADAEEILRLPISGAEFRLLKNKHSEFWKTFKEHDLFDYIDDYQAKHKLLPTSVFHYVDDEKADTEAVHVIGRDDPRKVIFCVFRGSATLSDWSEDAKVMVGQVPNPLADMPGQPATVGIHLGFRNYIFGRNEKVRNALIPRTSGSSTQTTSEKEKDSSPTRMKTVIEQLQEMKKIYPDYTIWVTGHSLGGALALIAAMGIASDPLLSGNATEKPASTQPCKPSVTCIAVGNPKPGDGAFGRVVETLERTQRLQCCVIHNSLDVVPMLATNLTRSDLGFWHPGWRLLLYKDRCEWGRSRASEAEHEAVIPMTAVNASSSSMATKAKVQEVVGAGGWWRCCKAQSSKTEVAMCNNKVKDNKEQEEASGWSISMGLKAIMRLSQQRINRHNHREYLERLMDQEEQLRNIRLTQLYDLMWSGNGSSDRPLEYGNQDSDVDKSLTKIDETME